MVNGLHLYSAFIQSAVQCLPLIHPFTHTFTHQRRLAAMQSTNQLIRSNWGLGVLLKDTSTRPGWDRTGNPLTARRLLLPPEPHHPQSGTGVHNISLQTQRPAVNLNLVQGCTTSPYRPKGQPSTLIWYRGAQHLPTDPKASRQP